MEVGQLSRRHHECVDPAQEQALRAWLCPPRSGRQRLAARLWHRLREWTEYRRVGGVHPRRHARAARQEVGRQGVCTSIWHRWDRVHEHDHTHGAHCTRPLATCLAPADLLLVCCACVPRLATRKAGKSKWRLTEKWSKRWFVLAPAKSLLSYYKNESECVNGKPPLGDIECAGATVCMRAAVTGDQQLRVICLA